MMAEPNRIQIIPASDLGVFSAFVSCYITLQKQSQRIPKHQQQWLAKFNTGFCGVGRMLKLYKFQQHDHCPICNTNDETTIHVLQCRHQKVVSKLSQETHNFHKWLSTQLIDTEMKNLILNSFKCVQHNNSSTLTPINNILQEAIKEQNEIGWFNFIQGFWSKQWRECQKQYLTLQQSAKSPMLILSKTQRKIWMIAWNMWLHRNSILHEENHSIHPNEVKSLDEVIVYEK